MASRHAKYKTWSENCSNNLLVFSRNLSILRPADTITFDFWMKSIMSPLTFYLPVGIIFCLKCRSIWSAYCDCMKMVSRINLKHIFLKKINWFNLIKSKCNPIRANCSWLNNWHIKYTPTDVFETFLRSYLLMFYHVQVPFSHLKRSFSNA